MVLVGALSSVSAFKVFSEVYLMAGPDGGPAGEDTTLGDGSSSAPAPA